MKNYILRIKGNKKFFIPTKVLDIENFRYASSKTSRMILKSLSENSKYPKEIAKEINLDEQSVYYHIRNLERLGFIEVAEKKNIGGIEAKYYKISSDAFSFIIKSRSSTKNIEFIEEFFFPFVVDGEMNSIIVFGSPDPHGPTRARARDIIEGSEFCLFLGCFLEKYSGLKVKIDTEIKKDDIKNNNLIVIGGPGVNYVAKVLNKKMPISFIERNNRYVAIYSKISKNVYEEERCGIIIKVKNPFNKDKYILLIAGRRASGTKAAILSFLKYFKDICNGNKYNNKVKAKVVEGVDIDSDSIIDDVIILE
jgi:DNA-binding transcriptional ArsR family regulator